MTMRAATALFCAGLCLSSALAVQAQDIRVETLIRNILRQGEPIATPIIAAPQSKSLSVTIQAIDAKFDTPHRLSAILSRPNPDGVTYPYIPLTMASAFVTDLTRDHHLALTIPLDGPKDADPFRVDVELRDMNDNLITRILQPIAYTDQASMSVALEDIAPRDTPAPPEFDTLFVETITGKILLPRKASLPDGAQLYIQLLENALAGGTRMMLAAEDIQPITMAEREIPFTLNRAIYDGADRTDLTFKVWIADPAGRKHFVMARPVAFNGPDQSYDIPLDALKRGADTKRGQNMPSEYMAQTIVQGEASFDPINGVPGQARLKVTLRQDRGTYTDNPVLAEQTLLLRGIETRIPFSLTTDSTSFDPYAPAPFLSVALTDIAGRVYYESGSVRATEGRNNLRLFPTFDRP